MKLINKINHNFISLAVFILFVGGVIFYIMLRKIILDQVDGQLLSSKNNIEQQFNKFLAHPKDYIWREEIIGISIVEKMENQNEAFFSDTLISISKKIYTPISYRKLEFYTHYAGNDYKVKILKNLSFTDHLTMQVLILVSVIAVFFIISFFTIFRLITQNSLIYFYDTVNKIKDFKVDKNTSIKLLDNDIDEFETLNKVLLSMTDKIKKDYNNLMEYNQNASHEIQTPLAIIQSNVEQLIQSEELTKEQVKTLYHILEATTRLSKLNRALLQLVKLEGGQYSKLFDVNIKSIVSANISQLKDIIEAKNIKLSTKLYSSKKIKINPDLIELLIFNLLKNAINHNVPNGQINVLLRQNTLSIANTGVDCALDLDRLSKRFIKGSQSNSLGLGLSIITKICDIYELNLLYSYFDKTHTFEVNFDS